MFCDHDNAHCPSLVVDWLRCSFRSDTDMNGSLLQYYCGYM